MSSAEARPAGMPMSKRLHGGAPTTINAMSAAAASPARGIPARRRRRAPRSPMLATRGLAVTGYRKRRVVAAVRRRSERARGRRGHAGEHGHRRRAISRRRQHAYGFDNSRDHTTTPDRATPNASTY